MERETEEVVREHEQWFDDMGIPQRTTREDRQMFPQVMRNALNGRQHAIQTERRLIAGYSAIMIGITAAGEILQHVWR